MKNFTTFIFAALMVLFSTDMYSQSTWKSPKSADEIKNPLNGDSKSIKEGKKLFNQLCAICHGSKGKGDGVASAGLNPKPTSFKSETFSKQTDGAIFWKITNGNAPMASYDKPLTKTQRWQIINYIRTFKK